MKESLYEKDRASEKKKLKASISYPASMPGKEFTISPKQLNQPFIALYRSSSLTNTYDSKL